MFNRYHLLFGVILALSLYMNTHDNDEQNEQDKLTKDLFAGYTAFMGAVGLVGNQYAVKILKTIFSEHPYLTGFSGVVYLLSFFSLYTARSLTKRKTIEKDWIENPDYVVNKKILWNRISVVSFMGATALIAVLCILHYYWKPL